jgi:hypothetical protein
VTVQYKRREVSMSAGGTRQEDMAKAAFRSSAAQALETLMRTRPLPTDGPFYMEYGYHIITATLDHVVHASRWRREFNRVTVRFRGQILTIPIENRDAERLARAIFAEMVEFGLDSPGYKQEASSGNHSCWI